MKSLLVILNTCLLLGLPLQSNAQTDYSGSWYNPARDGEGFHVEILGNGQALVIWFTYPGSSSEPESRQFWILGVGTFSAGVITINDAYQAAGPVFGPDYDKDDFERTTWGNLKITFTGPDAGRVEYDGLSGQGTTDVVRLTNLLTSGTTATLPPEISAAWYDPETDGQGWFVEVLSASAALVYWFTYDENGNPAWNLGVGTIYGNQIVVPDSRAGTGTRFGDEFDSDAINLDPLAMMTLDFTDCNTGRVRYLTSGGVVTGSFPIIRLTILDGYQCDGFSPAKLEQQLASNASDPLLSQYLGLDNTNVRLFGQKSGSGRANRLQNGLVQTGNGQSISFSLDNLGGLAFIQDSASSITLSAAMDAIGNSQVVLSDEENGVSSSQQTGEPDAVIAALESAASRKQKAPPVDRTESLEGGSAQVTVELCGETASNALVDFVLTIEGNQTVLPASQTAPGVYLTGLPTSLGPVTDDATITENCDLTGSQFDSLCAFLTEEDGGTGLDADDCLVMAQQIGVAQPESAMVAAATCETFRASINAACSANQGRAGNCSASSDPVFREFSDFDVSARVRIPGLPGRTTSPTIRYDTPGATVELPNVSVTGRPYYEMHAVNPANPAAGDTYRLDAVVGCVAAGQTLTVNNLTTGTSQQCAVDELGFCRTEIASSSGETSHVLEITGPGGFRHQLVQGLENTSTGGEPGDSGIWRTTIQGEIFDGLGFALSIRHPDAFYCQDGQGFDLVWDPALGIYNWFEFDTDAILGFTMEGDDTMCLWSGPPQESTCLEATRFSTWSEATQDISEFCPTPPWLSN